MRVYSHAGLYEFYEYVQLLLDVMLPHVVQNFAAFTYLSKLYVLQEGEGMSLLDHMISGSPFDDTTLLCQLSGVAKDFFHLRIAQDFAFELTPERILVTPGGPSILRLFINLSDVIRQSSWDPDCGQYSTPEAFANLRYSYSTDSGAWSLGCTYLEILVWHVMGYQELCSFRDRRLQSHSIPYFFSPAEPGTSSSTREHAAVVEMTQVLLSRTSGDIQEAVRVVETILRVNQDERLIMIQILAKFAHLAAIKGEPNDV